MIEIAVIVAGMSGLTLIGVYLGWRELRVVLLRQDMFAIRDELWDTAHRLEAFDDPAYLEAREILHAVIRRAHRIDLVTFAITLRTAEVKHAPTLPPARTPDMQSAIETALSKSYRRLSRYIVWERPFSGFALMQVANVIVFLTKLAAWTRRTPLRPIVQHVRRFRPDTARFWLTHHGPDFIDPSSDRELMAC